uniref:Testis expressed gene 16 n=1 Tax=Jaculus jaculus TaxID=51337 RepID=A0A8C5K303_JACJA
VRPKTSGLLHLEKISIKSPGVPESHLLDITGIDSPEERGKGTATLVAGMPGKGGGLDDKEIPTLKFTGFIHLEALINKCSPSSEYSHPRSPRNLWLESTENAESPGSDDLEVARSMYPFRERTIFRRSWAELIEAPLNSEGLHILQTTPTEETEVGYLQLQLEKENLATTPHLDQHFQALQSHFPLLPQHPKLQKQNSHSLPRYGDVRSRKQNAPSFTLNPEEKQFFFPSDHNLQTGKNTKERDTMEETWQAILTPSRENLPHNPRFENSAMHGNIEIPEDNAGRPVGNIIIPKYNVNSFPAVNFGISMVNSEVLWGIGDVPMGNFDVFGVPMGNLETFGHTVDSSRCIRTSPLTELSKIGEHQL